MYHPVRSGLTSISNLFKLRLFHGCEASEEKEKGEHMVPPTVLLIDSDGLSDYTCYLARGLAKYRNVVLYGFSKESYFATGAAKEKRIKFYYIKERLPKGISLVRIFSESILLFFVLLRVLAKSKYEIVHVQGHLPTFFLFIPMLKIRKKKICWTMHDVVLMPSYNGFKGVIELLFTKLVSQPWVLVNSVDVVVVHSFHLKRELISKGIPEDKICVIRHFDYRYLFNSNKNDEFRKSSDVPFHVGYIMSFGRITPYKGLDVFINASKIVKRKLRDTQLKFIIVGKGDTSYFDGLLTDKDYEYIQICNKYITSAEIPNLFRNALFVVLPYTAAFKYSVSGIIPLAYTFAKPVIVSDVSSLTEYVEHGKTGMIFETGNSVQLADYIIELIENKNKCAEMGKRAYQKMLEEMSLEECCEVLDSLYSKIVR